MGKPLKSLPERYQAPPDLMGLVPLFMTKTFSAIQPGADVVKNVRHSLASSLYDLRRLQRSKCEVGTGDTRLSLDPSEMESGEMLVAYQTYCIEHPAFAAQFLEINSPEDADFSYEDNILVDADDAEDDIGVSPEELEAALLLNIRNVREMTNEQG
ncbi:hypothetical protein QFC22_005237 [Naganishia vaughanmartiniae]|uniref:Uncharacterized protein n=1 Tax=Naganishia vaughanmartiniae TaxID=1424756 RepID=A0ACC2WUL3_9TREE|nr:hypothetical protein QFC22_005237 [Naganishia vaughanmartiniae]